MPTQTLTPTLKKQVQEIVEQFNRDNFPRDYSRYSVRFKGANAYFDRVAHNENAFQIFRLSYTGEISDWEFAIYRHSKDWYDPKKWFFPGAGLVDGTVQGALKAGLEAYPVMKMPPSFLSMLFRVIRAMFIRR